MSSITSQQQKKRKKAQYFLKCQKKLTALATKSSVYFENSSQKTKNYENQTP